MVALGRQRSSYKQCTCTTENRHFAECRKLCRVYFIGHSAKTVFAECQIKYTRQKKYLTKCVRAECLFSGTRQICILPSAIFRHTAKCVFAECLFSDTRQRCILPSAFVLALGKEAFCRVYFFCPRQIIFPKQFLRP